MPASLCVSASLRLFEPDNNLSVLALFSSSAVFFSRASGFISSCGYNPLGVRCFKEPALVLRSALEYAAGS